MYDLKNIQGLYDRHQFLEAYRESAAYWTPSTDVALLSVDELILGGRLAARLGGLRLSRWLSQAAYARDPTSPRVRYFSAGYGRRGRNLADYLRAFEQQPDLGGDDPEVRACWFAWQAATWASLRDFTRADASLERARSLAPNDSWVWSCESQVRGVADRWEDALKAAERAWEISPGAPYAARSLGDSLIHLGRVGESATRLSAATENIESYEVSLLAAWHQCALAETLDGEERRQVLDRARDLAESAPALAPLADREARLVFARARLDIAELLGDHEEMGKWVREVNSPFHRQVLEHLQRNPTGRRIVLPFRRAIQKHEACLPASVSSALAALGVCLDADTIASEITYGGTRPWAVAEWLKERGLTVRFFTARPEVAVSLIKNGIAFVLLMETDESSHAVAVVGLDESAGTLLIHDPQRFRTGKCLLDGMEQMKWPLGPMGMAVVPPEKTSLLDRLLPKEDTDVPTAEHIHQKVLMMNGSAAARQLVGELTERQPHHSGTRWLRAVQALENGRTGEALAALQHLLNEFPGCPYVRRRLVSACRALGNTALMREVLGNVVYCGRLPGIESDQEWRYPPPSYVCELADLLRLSAASRQEARILLHLLIRREWTFAGAWHVLGDLLWHERDRTGALLSFRLASCLGGSDDHYARAYSDALRGAGREGEGLSWLETRVRSLSVSSRSMGPFTAWMSALEDYGYPERALAACREALERHGGSSELLAFTVPFLARMGHWEESEMGLRRLEEAGHTPVYYEAAVGFRRMHGDLNQAIELAETWVRESPQSLPARQQLADLTAKRHGPHTAIDMAKRWSLQNPGHDQWEEVYCQQLDRIDATWKKDLVLRHRVKRNGEDGWAWRELTFRRLRDYEHANQRRREALQPLIARLLAECDRTAPEAPATLRLHAEWHTVRGEWEEAVVAWLKAIDAEPGSFYSYPGAWNCSAMLGDAARHQVYQQMESLLLGHKGRLENARNMIFLIAERFGVDAAEQATLRWKDRRGDEPELIESTADLLLAYGHGRTDAARALAVLEPAVRRFPYYVGLRFSLADACRRLGRDAEAEETLREVIRRHPDHTGAHVQLAWVYNRRGKSDEALGLLESAIARDPLNPEIWDARAGILIRNRRFSDARTTLREGVQRLADSVQWRERAIQRLLECGDDEGAVEIARDGVRIYPRKAYLWYLLGTTLRKASRLAAPGEIESCLQHSVSLDPSLFPAADNLATLLVEERRYEEAEVVMRRILPRLADSSPARGRLASIHRQSGRKAEALEEMVEALRAAPWYHWGWGVVMDWLFEDQAWDQARNLLCPNPPELRTDTHFRSKRLTLLGKAGLPAGEIDAEWNALLHDFPEDISLHLECYDRLRAEKRTEESAAVLNAIRSAASESPLVLARWVEVLTDQHNKDEAIDTLLHIWFAEVEGSPWAADYGWKAVEGSHYGDEVYHKARRRLDEGSRPTHEALSIMVAHAMRRETRKGGLQPLWRAWFPGAGAREVLAFLDLLHNPGGGDGGYSAVVFRHLSNYGYQRLVVGRWKKGRVVAEADVDSWSEIARALLKLGRKKEARRLLAGWREREGVRMWMVANFVLCFPRHRREHWQEVRSACQDALAGLPHDHCAKYLAHVQAEMCASLGDAEAFRQTWIKQRNYFSGKLEESDWFEDQRKDLLGDIPCMARLLEQDKTELFWKACRDLRKRKGASPGGNHEFLGLPWWVWWIFLMLALRLLSTSIGQH